MNDNLLEQCFCPRGKVQQEMNNDLQGLPPFEIQSEANWGNLFKTIFTTKEKQQTTPLKGAKTIKLRKEKDDSFTLMDVSDQGEDSFRRNTCLCLQCGCCGSKQVQNTNLYVSKKRLTKKQHLKDDLFTIHRRQGVLWKMKTILLKHTKLFRTINFWTSAANRRKSQLNEIKYCYEINKRVKQRKSSWIIPQQANEKRRQAIEARQSTMNNKPKSVIKIDQNHQIIRVKQDDPAEAMLKVKETTQKQSVHSDSSSSSDSLSLPTIKENLDQQPALIKKPRQNFQVNLQTVLACQKPSQTVQTYVKQKYKEHRRLQKKQQTTAKKTITQVTSLKSSPSLPQITMLPTPKRKTYLDIYLINSRRIIK